MLKTIRYTQRKKKHLGESLLLIEREISSVAGTEARTWAYGELSGGSSLEDFESSSSMSRAFSSSLVIYGEDAGVSCITGLPGTANPVANEYFESGPIPTSDAADEGRRFLSAYKLFRLLTEECDRLGVDPCTLEELPMPSSKLARCKPPRTFWPRETGKFSSESFELCNDP